MSLELKKRIITSILLLSLLFLMFLYPFVLIISSIVIGLISWIEFYALISKIVKKSDFRSQILRFIYKSASLIYLSTLVFFIITVKLVNLDLYFALIYSILISIMSDVGGLVIGKIFKGKKLNKISPNKTISGSLGSFIFSLLLVPFSLEYLKDYNVLIIILITVIISLTSQIGDLLISLLKRKAKVKNTSDLLPGHGGILDRIDGIILAVPMGLLIFSI
jgi:phosphatidate cytidylyltransferase|tara:strand:+ start:305 stop:964 length:660 start_codon:yes stop_codon:yes gene_type:complete